MKEVIVTILSIFKSYNGSSIYWLLFILGLVYLFFAEKKLRKPLVYPLILLTLVITNPILYKYVWIRFVGNTYWRMFWGIPSIFIGAFCVTDICRKISNQLKSNTGSLIKLGITLISLVCMIIFGEYMYGTNNFVKNQNIYKLPQDTIEVAEALLQLEDNPMVVVPDELYNYMRQYSTDIKLMFGRDTDGFICDVSNNMEYMAKSSINQDSIDISRLCSSVRESGYKYIVLKQSTDLYDAEMYNYGFKVVQQVNEKYRIYMDSGITGKSWTFSQHINKDANSSFVTVRDFYNRLVVIDGGSWQNNVYLRSVIQVFGNRVDSWLATNTKTQTIGSFISVENEPKGIVLGNYITLDIINDKYEQLVGSDNIEYRSLKSYNSKSWNKSFEYVNEGDKISDVIGMNLEFFNGYNQNLFQNSQDVESDSSMVCKFSGSKESLIYISDVTETLLNNLLDEYKDQLQCDYVILKSSISNSLLSKLKQTVGTDNIYIDDAGQTEEFSIELQ